MVVIEIGNDYLKILENSWKLNGRYNANIHLINFSDIKEVPEIIAGLFKGLKLNRQDVFTYVPRNLVTVRVLGLPSTNPKEIEDIMSIQVSKQTPYAKEEILSAYKILDGGREGYTKVLLFIAKRNVIVERIEALRQNNMEIDKLTVSSEGAYNWFNSVYTQEMNNDNPRTVVLLDIDSVYSDFIIIHKGKLAFTRNILIGANYLFTREDAYADKFIEELKYSIDMYQQEESDIKIAKIFLSGASLYLERLSGIISKGLNIPVVLTTITKKTRFNGQINVLKDEKLKFVSITALLGTMLKHKELEIDLVPGELRIQRLIEKKGKTLR